MKIKSTAPLADLAASFHRAEGDLSLDAAGRGRYAMHPETMKAGKQMQMAGQTKSVQSPAQHAAVEKAAQASAARRKGMGGLAGGFKKGWGK